MIDKDKLEKLKKLADAMYYAAQQLTTDASRLHKAMDEYHKFIINEYHKEEQTIPDIVDEHFDEMLGEEPVSKNFEAALAKEWQGYVDRGAATVDALEDNTQELAFAKGFYRGWNYPKSSVWHDANKEQPEIGSAVAVWNPKIMDGEIFSRCVEVYQDRIWAYIDDLLKL